MSIEKDLLVIASQLRTIAGNGLVYNKIDFDIDRYQEIRNLADKMSAMLTGTSVEVIANCYLDADDYITPKVDVRAVVFNDCHEILMVKERADGQWSLPGGWADVGYSPKEVAAKEVREETGLEVEPVRLLAVLDKSKHPHPPALHYAYKIFILCEVKGGEFTSAFDILDKGFFKQNELPSSLSEERILKSQIDLMFEYYYNPRKEVIVD